MKYLGFIDAIKGCADFACMKKWNLSIADLALMSSRAMKHRPSRINAVDISNVRIALLLCL